MDHDRLFKELLRTFFVEFIELFLPMLKRYLDIASIEFLDKEIFTDIASKDRHEVDLLVKARFKGRVTCFLIHLENQATSLKDFAARMFRYFARLHEKYGLPVYPIALLSYDSPQRSEPDRYRVDFPDLRVLEFGFRTIQLNRLNWRAYLRRPNPVAAALMTKMKIAPRDRPKVVLECLRMIATLKLDPARQTVIRSFMQVYLHLSGKEMTVYNQRLQKISPQERKVVMQVLNPWEREGMKRGKREGVRSVLLRQLQRKFGPLPRELSKRIGDLSQVRLESLAVAFLEFEGLKDVQTWLTRAR